MYYYEDLALAWLYDEPAGSPADRRARVFESFAMALEFRYPHGGFAFDHLALVGFHVAKDPVTLGQDLLAAMRDRYPVAQPHSAVLRVDRPQPWRHALRGWLDEWLYCPSDAPAWEGPAAWMRGDHWEPVPADCAPVLEAAWDRTIVDLGIPDTASAYVIGAQLRGPHPWGPCGWGDVGVALVLAAPDAAHVLHVRVVTD